MVLGEVTNVGIEGSAKDSPDLLLYVVTDTLPRLAAGVALMSGLIPYSAGIIRE
jgi:hypothetical protein